MGCFWVPRLVCNSLVFTQTKFASGIVNQELNWYYILCLIWCRNLKKWEASKSWKRRSEGESKRTRDRNLD